MISLSALSALAGESLPFNSDWRFHRGEPAASSQSPNAQEPGAALPSFEDGGWRTLSLPHDWSIELAPEEKAPGGGNVGYFPTGTGWYRRHFKAPLDWKGRRVMLRFEGIYMKATVWLNGTRLGGHPYGYTPFDVDLTEQLKLGEDNVLSVHVDNEAQPNTRWYSGSGIYRKARLVVSSPIHIPLDGLRVSTLDLDANAARLQVWTDLRNDSGAAAEVRGELLVRSPEGKTVASVSLQANLASGEHKTVLTQLAVPTPAVWSPDTPRLHSLEARISDNQGGNDRTVTRFGIRTVSVSAEKGFLLNGEPLKLLGGNVHHDNGALGAASFDRAEERKVLLLKEAGFNSVRCSHNPPAPSFLEACDRHGLLVIDESFDGWEHKKGAADYGLFFREWSSRDVRAMVTRDFNHPSVVLWSIGNETYERGNAKGRAIAQALASEVRSLDPHRPVTVGLNNPGEWTQLDGLFLHLDAAGYNYELGRHEADHARVPGRMMFSSESYQNEAFANWKIMQGTSYVIGDFVWSALDYLGESGIGRVFSPGTEAVPHWKGEMWPWHGAGCGDIDLTGWRKPVSFYRQILWDRGAKLHGSIRVPVPAGTAPGKDWSLSQWSVPPALPSWTWPGHEGRELLVEVFSRHEQVEVRLNGRKVGELALGEAKEFRGTLPVRYEPGRLEFVAFSGAKEVERQVFETAGPAAKLQLKSCRQQEFLAGGDDVFYCEITVVDAQGRLNPVADRAVRYSVTGPAQLLGIASGNLTDNSGYQANPRRTHEGRSLVVLRSGADAGRITLRAEAEGLPPAELTVESRKP